MKHYFNYRRAIDYAIAILTGYFALSNFSIVGTVFIWPTGDFYRNLMLSVSASGASLLGFVLAANTFLISHTQHERLLILRNSRGFGQLLEIMRSSLWRLLTLVICAGLGSLVAPNLTQMISVSVLVLTILCVLSLVNLIWATMSILAVPTI
jgi:hypothetical protein